MRDNEGETELATPLVVGVVPTREQPGTTNDTASTEQEWIAIRTGNRLVHGHDPHQTHSLDLLIRELVADQAGDFSVGGGERALLGFGPDLFGDPVTVVEEHALQDGDFVDHARGGLEIPRAKHELGFIAQTFSLAFQASDPVFTGGAVRDDHEVDHTISFGPATIWHADCRLSAEKLLGAFFATQLVGDRLEPITRFVPILRHGTILSSDC